MTTTPRARQERTFNPEDHEDPVRALTLALRGLTLGGRVRLPDGRVVHSRSVSIGPHKERRFTIIPSPETSTPSQRHQAMIMGHAASKTAEAAARKVLNKETNP